MLLFAFPLSHTMFVTYTHIDEIKAPEKKRQVISYQIRRRKQLKATSAAVPKHDARKTHPSSALPSSGQKGGRVDNQRPQLPKETMHVDDPRSSVQEVEARHRQESAMCVSLGGLRGEPFNTYPVNNSYRVQLMVDYCELRRRLFVLRGEKNVTECSASHPGLCTQELSHLHDQRWAKLAIIAPVPHGSASRFALRWTCYADVVNLPIHFNIDFGF